MNTKRDTLMDGWIGTVNFPLKIFLPPPSFCLSSQPWISTFFTVLNSGVFSFKLEAHSLWRPLETSKYS